MSENSESEVEVAPYEEIVGPNLNYSTPMASRASSHLPRDKNESNMTHFNGPIVKCSESEVVSTSTGLVASVTWPDLRYPCSHYRQKLKCHGCSASGRKYVARDSHNTHGPKRWGGVISRSRGELGPRPRLTQCGPGGVNFCTKWHHHPSSRMATIDIGRKLGAVGRAPFKGELGQHLTQRRWAEAYLRTKCHLEPRSLLTTIDMG